MAYSLNEHSGTDVLTTVATLLVVLSLPLSSLWATANNNTALEKTTVSEQEHGEGFMPMNDNGDGYRNGGNFSNAKYAPFSQQLNTKLSSDTLAPTMRIEKTDGLSNIQYSGSNSNHDNIHHRDVNKTMTSDTNPSSASKGYSEKELAETHELTKVSSPLMDIYAPSTTEDEETRKFWMTEDKNLDGKEHRI